MSKTQRKLSLKLWYAENKNYQPPPNYPDYSWKQNKGITEIVKTPSCVEIQKLIGDQRKRNLKKAKEKQKQLNAMAKHSTESRLQHENHLMGNKNSSTEDLKTKQPRKNTGGNKTWTGDYKSTRDEGSQFADGGVERVGSRWRLVSSYVIKHR